MKLLIVEDEAKLADYLRKGLAEEGYVVEVAGNGIDGLHMATEGSHDLIVLDTMLPGIDGLGLLAALRQSKQSRSPNWWPASRYCCAAPPTPRRRLTPCCCRWVTCRWTWRGDVQCAPASVWNCPQRSFSF